MTAAAPDPTTMTRGELIAFLLRGREASEGPPSTFPVVVPIPLVLAEDSGVNLWPVVENLGRLTAEAHGALSVFDAVRDVRVHLVTPQSIADALHDLEEDGEGGEDA